MNNFVFFNDICDGKDRHINEHKVCKKKNKKKPFNGHFDAYNDEVHQSVNK